MFIIFAYHVPQTYACQSDVCKLECQCGSAGNETTWSQSFIVAICSAAVLQCIELDVNYNWAMSLATPRPQPS